MNRTVRYIAVSFLSCCFISTTFLFASANRQDSCAIKYSYRVYYLDWEYYAFDTLKKILNSTLDSIQSEVPYLVGDSTFIYFNAHLSTTGRPIDKVKCNCDSVRVSFSQDLYGGDAFASFLLVFGFANRDINGRVIAAGSGDLRQCLQLEIKSPAKSDTLAQKIISRKNKTNVCYYDSTDYRVMKITWYTDSTKVKTIETPADHSRKEVRKRRGVTTRCHGWHVINGKKKRFRYKYRYRPMDDFQ